MRVWGGGGGGVWSACVIMIRNEAISLRVGGRGRGWREERNRKVMQFHLN